MSYYKLLKENLGRKPFNPCNLRQNDKCSNIKKLHQKKGGEGERRERGRERDRLLL